MPYILYEFVVDNPVDDFLNTACGILHFPLASRPEPITAADGSTLTCIDGFSVLR